VGLIYNNFFICSQFESQCKTRPAPAPQQSQSQRPHNPHQHQPPMPPHQQHPQHPQHPQHSQQNHGPRMMMGPPQDMRPQRMPLSGMVCGMNRFLYNFLFNKQSMFEHWTIFLYLTCLDVSAIKFEIYSKIYTCPEFYL